MTCASSTVAGTNFLAAVRRPGPVAVRCPPQGAPRWKRFRLERRDCAMGQLFAQLDEEWRGLAVDDRLAARTRSVLRLCPGAACWGDVARWMADAMVGPAEKNGLLRALVERSVRRVALALLMPGVVAEVARHQRRPAGRAMPVEDLEAEVVGIVWELLSGYPLRRAGNVAANVLLDLRKRLVRPPVSVRAISQADPTKELAELAEPDPLDAGTDDALA